MFTNRRAASSPRALSTRRSLAVCGLFLLPLLGVSIAQAEDGGGSVVPDPSVWGTVEETGTPQAQPQPIAPEQTAPDSVDARPPVAKMIWKTITTPSGRTFQVLEAATPEEIEQARAATPGSAGVTPVSTADPAGTTRGAAAENTDLASIADLGSRPMRRNGNVGPGQPFPGGTGVSSIAAFGVYGGYSSTAGLQVTVPADGTFAWRMGLTGFPGLGWLWTPGVELRFGQERGTFNTDGVYGFSNLYIGETLHESPDKQHWGMETGAGFRWILPDRRSVRWIAAIELGGRWTTESASPKTPTVRAFWMIAAP
ncbi:MAG: hypothetical protein R3E97_15690 [Candidatus Eisenbacteria bacterium]